MSSLTRSVRAVNTPELPKTEEIDWTTGAPISLELLPDEPPQDFEPSREDYEWIAACNLASFLPREQPFAEWIRAKSGQAAMCDGERGEWLARQLEQLAGLAEYFKADDPQTFDERKEYYDLDLTEGMYHKGYNEGHGAAMRDYL
jgi:hypothetical protein